MSPRALREFLSTQWSWQRRHHPSLPSVQFTGRPANRQLTSLLFLRDLRDALGRTRRDDAPAAGERLDFIRSYLLSQRFWLPLQPLVRISRLGVTPSAWRRTSRRAPACEAA